MPWPSWGVVPARGVYQLGGCSCLGRWTRPGDVPAKGVYLARGEVPAWDADGKNKR